jgi:hypothetical protein
MKHSSGVPTQQNQGGGTKKRVGYPAMVMATVRSGEVTKEWVAGLASLRPVKFRL